MLLLTLSLLFIRKIPAAVEQASSSLLSHLSLLFVPAGVGLMVHLDRLGEEWLPISIALVVSTLISLVATAWIMQRLVQFTRRANVKNSGQHD